MYFMVKRCLQKIVYHHKVTGFSCTYAWLQNDSKQLHEYIRTRRDNKVTVHFDSELRLSLLNSLYEKGNTLQNEVK